VVTFRRSQIEVGREPRSAKPVEDNNQLGNLVNENDSSQTEHAGEREREQRNNDRQREHDEEDVVQHRSGEDIAVHGPPFTGGFPRCRGGAR